MASPTTVINPIHPDFLDRLDKDFIEYHNTHLSETTPQHAVPVSEVRENPKKHSSPWFVDFSSESFVNDIKVPSLDGYSITVRKYEPDETKSPFATGPYPVHINFHGGGFTLGGLTSDAEICMYIRNRVGILVLDVEYRLAPEHIWGKGHDDCWAVTQWVHEHAHELNAKADSISIGGISAGANISAIVQQLARDINLPLRLAFLGVPSTADHMHYKDVNDSEFASIKENEFAPCLNWARMSYFLKAYAPKNKAEAADRAARPAFFRGPIEGNVQGVCDTYVATAGCDPLRDEGELYARKLIENGVRTTVRRYTGVPHPFMHMLPIKKAQTYADDLCQFLRSAHESGK